MSAPSSIRSTAGFRSLSIFERNANGYPIGALTLQVVTPFLVSGSSGSVISSGSGTTLPIGTAVAGPVPYYGALASGAKVLTITDPQPRVLTHFGDDGPFSLQVLPATEPLNGELHLDKTNDVVDAIIANLKRFQVGEMNMLGGATNKRGFENKVAALAYSFAQDTDPDSVNYGSDQWDFRIYPKVTIFKRDTGYGQDVNERMYSFTPSFATAHLWNTLFSNAVEGFTRGQDIRGNCVGKPTFCTWMGDGSSKGFPFDFNLPATAVTKMMYWKNGVPLTVGASFTASINGLVFPTTAPLSTDVIECLYEA
jgi:hypothetical protein